MSNDNSRKYIELISDQAVTETQEGRPDSLGFQIYAKVMSRVVKGTRGPFTIGIFGEWGMGKTSLMRLIEEEVNHRYKNDPIVIPVWFNAWMFEKVEYPIIPLIKSITDELKLYEATAKFPVKDSIMTLVDTLNAVARAFKLRGGLGKEGVASVDAEVDLQSFTERWNHLRRRRKYGIDSTDKYEEIFDALRKISGRSVPADIKILVLIDDLDRCFPENAVKLLEGVKLILAQQGFVFILGASRVVIEEYLQSKYEKSYGIKHFDGRAYLDKMIQLSFDIPPHTDRINQFTDSLIANIKAKTVSRDLKSISKTVGVICQYNPRTIIRFMNRLITDVAIYEEYNNGSAARSKAPVGIFAVTRSLQYSWKDFYGLLISGDPQEDTEYCNVVSEWSSQDLLDWTKYGTSLSNGPQDVAQAIGLQYADPEVLRDIAILLSKDKVLRSLMDSKIGRQWLRNHNQRDTSITFLTSQIQQDEDLRPEPVKYQKSFREPIRTSLQNDDVYDDALRVILEARKASTSLLQRRLRIGYSRAARIIEQLEDEGIVGPLDGAKPREVLINSIEELPALSRSRSINGPVGGVDY